MSSQPSGPRSKASGDPSIRGTMSRSAARLPSLTGLRFFAAVLVFAFHSSLTNFPLSPFADKEVAHGYEWLFSKAGWMGVSFFFILSGFVLTWSAKDSDRLTSFWRRRLLKIYPNHVVVWVLAMLLFAAQFTPVSAWLPNLFLIHSWFPQHDTFISVNLPSWSLCSELLFYLLFPFFLMLVRKIPVRRLWLWAGLMVAGMIGVQLVVQFLLPDSPQTPEKYPLSVMQWWFAYNFPPVRLFEFVLGMITARAVLAGRWIRLPVGAAGALVVLSYAAALAAPWLYGLYAVTAIPLALLIVSVARIDIAERRTFLRSRVAIWLGEISFGFYVIHYVVMYVVRTMIMDEGRVGTPAGIAVLGVILAVSVVGGWVLYTCVERPVMRRWGRARKAAPPAPAVPAEESHVQQQSQPVAG
ncbi:acyltransferase family protein [Streptomyces violascens]|uniref:Acyltransferase n=1 Tax=Streptomyces violascens TaxID=67381 RepID=A0ABQ3R280_9ACTN|nr:acyltransferase [Streptomyces violascens]GGU32434.1 acyltransferase [Streptomyces violascens]GHI43641.1 acyltransferase [Streptomyces violascens]